MQRRERRDKTVPAPLHPDEAYDDCQKRKDNYEGERDVMQCEKNRRPDKVYDHLHQL
jgi:hypothetical protein